jgi:hypothetical protein
MFPSASNSVNGSPALVRERVRALALEAGFAEAGVVALPHTADDRDGARFEQWVRAGRAAGAVASERSVSMGAVGHCVLCQLQLCAASLD